MKRLLILTSMLLAALSLYCQSGGEPSICPLDRADFTNPEQFRFMNPILKDAEVVSLGESIHMTHEFPLVRLGLVRYLNENLGFHFLVMEGSAPDVWIAQDRLLESGGQDAKSALGGFFALWNTREMQRIIEYESASWRSPNPLYIAGYDVQAGNGRGSQGAHVFGQLVARLKKYALPAPGFNPDQWLQNVTPLADHSNRPVDHQSVEGAIQTLQEWIERAAPAIEKRYPNLPHAAMLRLIPNNLRAVLKFKEDLASPDPQGYQGLRDINAARFVVQLKNAADRHRLMLWAHISHLHNDNAQAPASVGGILHNSLGSHLYTIAPLAESGDAILIFPAEPNEDIGYGRVHGNRGQLGQYLSGLGKTDYFLDLRSLPPGSLLDQLARTPQPIWTESGQRLAVIAREYDGIIWIKTVHAPELTKFVLVISVIHYRNYLIVLGSAVPLAALVFAAYWRKRRKMQASSHFGP